MSANKAAAEKLPLATRKNGDILFSQLELWTYIYTVRDSWDNKKPELESQLADLLGVPWTFDINPLIIWPYAEEGSYGHNSLGDCIYA